MTPSRLIGSIRKAVSKQMPARSCFGIADCSRNLADRAAQARRPKLRQSGVDGLTGILTYRSSDSGQQVNLDDSFELDIASFFSARRLEEDGHSKAGGTPADEICNDRFVGVGKSDCQAVDHSGNVQDSRSFSIRLDRLGDRAPQLLVHAPLLTTLSRVRLLTVFVNFI
jgi:hypothetical protein